MVNGLNNGGCGDRGVYGVLAGRTAATRMSDSSREGGGKAGMGVGYERTALANMAW
jgi:hypothetical protein